MAGSRLGFGLGEMLSRADLNDASVTGEQQQVKIVNSEDLKDDSLVKLPIGVLDPGKYQPRKNMDPESLEELTSSIRQQGIIQPIVVRKCGERFEILAGERRWRAALKAGLENVPAVIMNADDRSAMAIAIIENMQRQNLNVIEESEALQRLAQELSITHEQIGEMIGKSRSQVTNLLRLSSLSEPVKKLVTGGSLDMGHARALLAIENQELQAQTAETVAKKAMSVRETEAFVSKVLKQAAEGTAPEKNKFVKDQNLIEWENKVKDHIGCSKVQLVPGTNGNGKLVMTYKNDQELEKLMSFLNKQSDS